MEVMSRPVRQIAQQGFTLIELAVVIALIAIFAGIAVPAMQQYALNGKLRGYANSLVASAVLARSEAIKRNAQVRLCVANADGTACESGNWEAGWIVIASDGQVIHRQQAITDGFLVLGDVETLVFQGTGVGSTAADLTICRATPTVGGQERLVSISATGRTSVEKQDSTSCAHE